MKHDINNDTRYQPMAKTNWLPIIGWTVAILAIYAAMQGA